MQRARRAVAGLLLDSSRLVAAQAQSSPLSLPSALWKSQFGDAPNGVSRASWRTHFDDFSGIGFVWPGMHSDAMEASSVKKKRRKKMKKHKHRKLRRRERHRTKGKKK